MIIKSTTKLRSLIRPGIRLSCVVAIDTRFFAVFVIREEAVFVEISCDLFNRLISLGVKRCI